MPAKPEWRSLGRLWPYLREFPLRVGIALSLLVAAKLAGVSLPLVMKHLVDALDTEGAAVVAIPLLLLLFYGVLRLIVVLFSELRDVIFGRVAERAMRRAALEVFRHLHRLDLGYHLSRQTGGLSRDIERGVSGISFLLRFLTFNIVPTLFEMLLVAGILLVQYGWVYAMIVLGAVSSYVLFSVVVTEWRTRFVRAANQLDSQANTRAIDSLLNYETVKLFVNEDYEAREYDRALADWERAQRRNRKSLATLNIGQAIIIAGSVTGIMVLASAQVAAGDMTIGDFVAINAYMTQLFIPLNVLGFVYREIRRALTDMQRMLAMLDVAPAVVDEPGARTLAVRTAAVSFEQVGFAYDASRPILRELSFEIPAGRTVAVVGASGAGKSTLARLLFRFYNPDRGRILVGGRDIADYTQNSLRTHIGVVPQDTVLFNDSLAYNIGYGRPGASREDIERVVRLAHLDGFVAQLPDGLDTQVGERGLKLSGGEKQRVSIARALLKDPPIMIFDEATSSLDTESERAILGALAEAARQRTTLVIAHRLSTVVDADQIIVLRHGLIVERGSHTELLEAGGDYAHLWNLQRRELATVVADPAEV